jgi:hypothetical protein
LATKDFPKCGGHANKRSGGEGKKKEKKEAKAIMTTISIDLIHK